MVFSRTGLTWNEKTNKFYYIDSVDLDVKEFDYDPKTKNICKLKLEYRFKVTLMLPFTHGFKNKIRIKSSCKSEPPWKGSSENRDCCLTFQICYFTVTSDG